MYHNAPSDHFDLLPFIAILMCVLGCLLLVTISMAVINMGVGAGEAWVPTPQTDTLSNSKQPILVEWDGKTATFHEDSGISPVKWTEKPTPEPTLIKKYLLPLSSSADDNPEFAQVMERIQLLAPTHYVLIAVRPSGFATMDSFTQEFRAHDITVGYEPIEQNKPVRLTLPSSPPR